MAADLERLIGSVDSEGPSPEFMARLREQIVEESEMRSISTPMILGLDSDPAADQRSPSSRWILLVAAAIAIVGGFVLSFADDEAELVVALEDTAPVFIEEATLLPAAFAQVEPGTYRVNTVGTPFTLTIEEPLAVRVNDLANVHLAMPNSQGAPDRNLVFTRLSALVDPARPIVESISQAEGWPADDFAGWIDAVGDEFVISNQQSVTLGGRDAIRIDLELGEAGCAPGGVPCTVLGTNGSVTYAHLFPSANYQLWVVEMESEDPLFVMAGIGRADDDDWFNTVESILLTLSFGDPAPNPILGSGLGPTEAPFLGGVRFDLADGSFVVRDPLATDRVEMQTVDAHTGFVTSPRTADGRELTNADDLVATLRSAGVDATEIEMTSIAGVPTRVFDLAGPSSEPMLWPVSSSSEGWEVPPRSRIWLIDHPDRGLQMVTAEAGPSGAVDAVFALVVAHTEDILGSLEFLTLE